MSRPTARATNRSARCCAGSPISYYYGTLSNCQARPAWAVALRPLPAARGGVPFPRARADPCRRPTPRCDLGLKPGDLVRVKPYEEILAGDPDTRNSNRGLFFDAELVPYCGGIYPVGRGQQLIDARRPARCAICARPPSCSKASPANRAIAASGCSARAASIPGGGKSG